MKNIIQIILPLLLFAFASQAQHQENWLVMGNNNLNSSNLLLALDNYTEHIEKYPEDPMGYIYRARLFKAMGRESDSKFDLRFAQNLNPMSLMLIDPSLRSKYTAKKSFGFDFQNLDQSFLKSPSRSQDYSKVISQFNLSKAEDSIISNVVLKLNEFKIQEAADILNTVAMTDKNKAILNDLMGKIEMKREDYFSAIEYFNRSIDADPSFSIAYHNRSICHKNLGDYEEAQKDLDRAIGLDSDISMFFFTEAKLYELMGKPDAAIESYEIAIENDNDYQEALVNYSQLLKGLGDYSQGIKYMNKAIGPELEGPEKIFLEANLDFIYGEFENAIEGYEEYLNLFIDDSSALFNMGLSKILLRKYDDGCDDIEVSLEIDENEKHQKIYKLFCLQNATAQ